MSNLISRHSVAVSYYRDSGSIRLIKFDIYQGVHFKSAKKRKGMLVGFVSFETAEQVKSAVEV